MAEDCSTKHCLSCACPVDGEHAGADPKYCRYCVDETGKLLPKERILAGMAKWLKSLEPGISDETALKRANHYMLSMPAWAED